MNDDKEFKCNEVAAVVFIPENTVRMNINASVLCGNDIKKVACEYNLQDVIDSRNKYLKLDPDDDMFYTYKLTDEELEMVDDE